MSVTTIEQALAQHTATLMAVPGVVGTAIGIRGNQMCILVLASQMTRELAQLPQTLSGFPVEVEITASFPGSPSSRTPQPPEQW